MMKQSFYREDRMKAAVYHGPMDIRFEEIAKPVMEGKGLLLKVKACGICGSDLHMYKHGLFEDLGAPVETGRVLGHEFSGQVAEIQGDIAGFKVGDRVCTIGIGGNAEYIAVPELLLPMVYPVPDQVSFEEAATVEPLATSLHAVNLAKPAPGENHIILGAGIIGLGVLQVLKTVPDIKTVIVDVSEKRLEMARQLGAEITINAREEDALEKIVQRFGVEQMSFIPDRTGRADTAYDCAGLSLEFTGTPVLKQAVSMVKENGKVVVVAVFEKPPDVNYNLIVRKGITLYGSWGWSIEEFKQSLDLITEGKVDRRPLITHRFSLERAAEAYETQLKTKEAVKVMIMPD